MSGVYPVGTRLPIEGELAATLRVGRSSIREAVKILVSKGLLTVAPRRGTVVQPLAEWKQLDPDLLNWQLMHGSARAEFLQHLAELRFIFEPHLAEAAALRRQDADVGAIFRALADMREASPESSEAVDADVRFHNAVAFATGNPLLGQLAKSLEPLLRRSFDVAEFGTPDGYRANLSLHQDIADAIARQDPAKAASAARLLITRARHDQGARTAAEGAGGASRVKRSAPG